jgi:hypothetical protein
MSASSGIDCFQPKSGIQSYGVSISNLIKMDSLQKGLENCS